VNIESVRLGRPESRTILMAAATASLTEPEESWEPDGATEKATSMLESLGPKVRRMPWRPLKSFDWNSRSCGLHGHATYAPTEPSLAARLQATTPLGDAWRCLRCGAYVLGEPHGSGHADDAPIVLRGKALRDAFVLRFLALERLGKGLLLVALAYGVWRFDGSRAALQQVFADYLPALKPLASKLSIDLQETGPVRLIEQAFNAKHSTLLLVAGGVLLYGILQLTEAVGLWLMKRWGEYVAAVATTIFIPLEVYELVEKVTWLRVAALVVNLFAIAYLVFTKRLFGVRGGHAAFVAERHSASLIEVERSASSETAPVGAHSG
jgi:uncharacterized membrane protein (DUF2068 family)